MNRKGLLKYAVVFPGQGSQYPGMGKDIAQKFECANQVYEQAERITGLELREICFGNAGDKLSNTMYTQPCLLATSLACYAAFKESFELEPSFLCGHSAGEYAAVAEAGIISFKNAFELIRVRGKLMSQADEGGMAALIGASREEVLKLCKEAVTGDGTLVPANWNSPGQTVISGDMASIESAIDYALENNIKIIPLDVSGGFHSPLMKASASEFLHHLNRTPFSDASVPVVSNVLAEPFMRGRYWVELLYMQMFSPVMWEQSIHYIHQQGVEIFLEVGPGNVLSKLIKRIIPSALVLNIEDAKSLELAVAQLDSESMEAAG